MKPKLTIQSTSKTQKRWLIFAGFALCGATFYFFLTRLGLLMPLSELPGVLCLSSCQPERAVHPLIAGEELLNDRRSLQELLGSNITHEKVSMLVEKSKHRLTVFYNLKPIKSYRVVFGTSPSGDKLYEGDRKTPEGIYSIRNLYPHSDWSKFIWLDYPTSPSWREHVRAKLAGEINWLLPIGGQIGIHGVPNGGDDLIDRRSNWTWGCISLKNHDVNEIYQLVKIGTVVEIVP